MMKTPAYSKTAILSIPIIIGVVLCVFGGQFVLKAQKTKNWQQTMATIARINLTETISSSSATNSKNTFDISVSYHYQDKDKQYLSNKFSFGEGKTVKSRLKNKLIAQQWLASSPYKKGNKLNIYYDPENPQQAVIKTGASIWTFVPLIIGLILTSVFVLIFWRSKR